MKKTLYIITFLLASQMMTAQCPACCCFSNLETTTASTDDQCASAIGSATVVGSLGSPGYAYIWSTGATTATITGLLAGDYYVTTTDQEGCTIIDTIMVMDNAGPTVMIDDTSDDELCTGFIGTITTTVTGGVPTITYQWTGPGITGSTTAPDINWSQGGQYTVVVTDSNGCTSSDQITTIINPLPTPTASNTGPYCEGADIMISVDPHTSYSWTGPNSFTSTVQNPTITNSTVAMDGVYNVTVTDSNGCTGTSSTVVSVNGSPDINSILSTDDACDQNIATVTAQILGGAFPYDIDFGNGQTITGSTQANNTISNVAGGTYTLTVTDVNGCTDTATYTVNELSNPNVTISGDITVCESDIPGTLIATAGNTPDTGPYTYAWTTTGGNILSGANSNTITYDAAGTYTVTVTDSNGCITTSSQVVTVDPSPDAELNTTAIGFCRLCEFGGRSIGLLAESAGAGPGEWYIGDVSAACDGTGTVINSPGSYIPLNDGLSFVTWVEEGTGACAGTYDCHVISIYTVLEIDYLHAELQSADDPCNCTGVFTIDLEDISNSGDCLDGWVAADGVDGTFNTYSWNGLPGTVTNGGLSYEIDCTDLPANTITTIDLLITNDNSNVNEPLCTEETFSFDIDTQGCCTGLNMSSLQIVTPSGCFNKLQFDWDDTCGDYDYSWTFSGTSDNGTVSNSIYAIPSSIYKTWCEGNGFSDGNFTITVTDCDGCSEVFSEFLDVCDSQAPIEILDPSSVDFSCGTSGQCNGRARYSFDGVTKCCDCANLTIEMTNSKGTFTYVLNKSGIGCFDTGTESFCWDYDINHWDPTGNLIEFYDCDNNLFFSATEDDPGC